MCVDPIPQAEKMQNMRMFYAGQASRLPYAPASDLLLGDSTPIFQERQA